jgi:hypothetical protein
MWAYFWCDRQMCLDAGLVLRHCSTQGEERSFSCPIESEFGRWIGRSIAKTTKASRHVMVWSLGWLGRWSWEIPVRVDHLASRFPGLYDNSKCKNDERPWGRFKKKKKKRGGRVGYNDWKPMLNCNVTAFACTKIRSCMQYLRRIRLVDFYCPREQPKRRRSNSSQDHDVGMILPAISLVVCLCLQELSSVRSTQAGQPSNAEVRSGSRYIETQIRDF